MPIRHKQETNNVRVDSTTGGVLNAMEIKTNVNGWICAVFLFTSSPALACEQRRMNVVEFNPRDTSSPGSRQTTEVDALFSQWDKPDSPGCVVGVIREGQLVYHRGFGVWRAMK